MSNLMVFAFEDHFYEDRANRRIYNIRAGHMMELPEETGRFLLEAHPQKLKLVENQSQLDEYRTYFFELNPVAESAPYEPIKVRYSPQKRKIRVQTRRRSSIARKQMKSKG